MDSRVRKIRIKNNLVGIIDLDRVLAEVAASFGGVPDEVIGEELLKRLSADNYIPYSARTLYREAFLREYKKFTGQAVEEEKTEGIEVIVLGSGCSQCHQLKDDCLSVMAELGLAGAVDHIEDLKEIARHGVMGTPALLINGKVVSEGRVPSRTKIREWLLSAHQK